MLARSLRLCRVFSSSLYRISPTVYQQINLCQGRQISSTNPSKMVAVIAEGRALSRGKHTLSVPMALFAENRQRLHSAMREKLGNNWSSSTAAVFEGGVEKGRYHTDADGIVFRQESFFFWAFGVKESECLGAITGEGKSILFMPLQAPSYNIWCGKALSCDEFKSEYAVDEVHWVKDMAKVLSEKGIKTVHTLEGLNSDSKEMYEPAAFEGKDKFAEDKTILFNLTAELRVHKTDEELKVLRYAVAATNAAHKEMMRIVKAGLYEYQLESTFRYSASFSHGCRHVGYTCISGSGPNGAVLHYGHAGLPNERELHNGDLCMTDMGAEYACYTADVSTTFPVNGKFTKEQAIIYNAVLDANLTVQAAAKPGADYVALHLLAERTIVTHLKAAGLLVGDLEAMLEANMSAVFMPHGLGHMLGLDVHDVGGYLPHCPPRPKRFGLSSLRMARILEHRMFITIEPGCYFIDHLLDLALANDAQKGFINLDELAKYRGMGGVRIEDNVLITETGCENFTIVPRTIEDIEKYMAENNLNVQKLIAEKK